MKHNLSKIQQDEIYQTKLQVIRAAMIKGEQSGEASSFDIQEIIAEAKNDAGVNG